MYVDWFPVSRALCWRDVNSCLRRLYFTKQVCKRRRSHIEPGKHRIKNYCLHLDWSEQRLINVWYSTVQPTRSLYTTLVNSCRHGAYDTEMTESVSSLWTNKAIYKKRKYELYKTYMRKYMNICCFSVLLPPFVFIFWMLTGDFNEQCVVLVIKRLCLLFIYTSLNVNGSGHSRCVG